MSACRVGVVGHVEWVEFAVVAHMPAPGEIVHALECFEEAAGGGAVAVVQLARLAGSAGFFTALAGDRMGRSAADRLEELGVTVHAAERFGSQRRAFVHLDSSAERTITVLGHRVVPSGEDPLPWEDLGEFDAVYFTGGDVAALRAARAARRLVATPRAAATLLEAGVELDVLVNSGTDRGEALDPDTIEPRPRHVVSTFGARGGRWIGAEGAAGTWEAHELPGPPVDAYGAGDSFAAGLTYGLGMGMGIDEAVGVGARCGAACMTGRGPYAGQLRLAR